MGHTRLSNFFVCSTAYEQKEPLVVASFKSAGVEFIECEPGAGIVGASGLLLGLGKLQGIQGGCLISA